MVKKWNADSVSLTQTIGVSLGVFMSTTWYFALNSLDFWNSYIYSIPQNKPIINESSFFLYWGYFILIIALITLIFGNEKYDQIKVEEHGLTIKELLNTAKWSLKTKQIIFFIVFCLTTWYFALNSLDFWNSYIYSIPQNKPIINESSFFLYWGYFILIIALITLIFGNEKYDQIKVEEHGLTIKELLNTAKWSLKTKQIIFFIVFCLSLKAFGRVNNLVGNIYLLDELKYNQSKYSFISFIGFPIKLLSPILVVKLGQNFKVLHKLVIIWVLRAIFDIITINILYALYSPGLTFDILLTLSNWLDIITFISWHSLIANYINLIANPIIASTHVTFVHSLTNFCEDFPKLYTYVIIDIFGVFIPNIIGCTLTLLICAWLYNKTRDPDLYKVMEISRPKKKLD